MKISEIEAKVIDYMGTDLSVVNAARVSFHKESDWYWSDHGKDHLDYQSSLRENDEKLINYLAKHKHFSPFNHTFISTRIKAPIFVARQLVKHKFMPWNEVSRRYVDEEPEFYIPKEWRGAPVNSKQGSSDVRIDNYMIDDGSYLGGPEIYTTPHQELEDICATSLETYNDFLGAGIAPEMARMILPQNMMTEWIWSGTLGAFADMLHLRLDPHAQYESRIVAEKLKEQIEPLFPVSLKALLENK